jgi:catalase-peroxidase
MLKVKLQSAVLLALALSQVGYSEEHPPPSKNAADSQTMSNQFWWPERLNLAPLRQHSSESTDGQQV